MLTRRYSTPPNDVPADLSTPLDDLTSDTDADNANLCNACWWAARTTCSQFLVSICTRRLYTAQTYGHIYTWVGCRELAREWIVEWYYVRQGGRGSVDFLNETYFRDDDAEVDFAEAREEG